MVGDGDESERAGWVTRRRHKTKGRGNGISSLLLALSVSTKCNIGTAFKIEIRMGVSAGLLFLKPSFFGHESFSMGFLILKVIVQAKL